MRFEPRLNARFDPRVSESDPRSNEILPLPARMSLELEHYNSMRLTTKRDGSYDPIETPSLFIAQTRKHFMKYMV